MRFSFVGNIQMNDEESKVPYVRSGKTKSGVAYKSFTCGVKAGDQNMAWNVELFGMDNQTIKTVNTDNKPIEIDKADCHDKDVIDSVASYRKYIFKLDEDRKEFISPYEAVNYLVENNDTLKKGRYRVTGMVNKDFYEGKTRDRFQIQNIYSVDDDTKNKLETTTVYYITKDSIDTADWSSEKKININGYISTYISDEKKNMYISQPIVFDASKIDFENEKHVKLLKFKLGLIGCELDDDKIKVKLKANNVYSIAAILRYFNGAEQEEVTLDMLSDTQREAIELGLKTLDDFKGNVYGERVTIYKLVDFNLKSVEGKDYSDGYVDEETKFSEFEENIYIASALNSSDTKTKTEESDDEEDDEDDDLFS